MDERKEERMSQQSQEGWSCAPHCTCNHRYEQHGIDGTGCHVCACRSYQKIVLTAQQKAREIVVEWGLLGPKHITFRGTDEQGIDWLIDRIATALEEAETRTFIQ